MRADLCRVRSGGGCHLPFNGLRQPPLAGRLASKWNALRPKKQTYFFQKSSEIREQASKMWFSLMTFQRNVALAYTFLNKFASGPHFLTRFSFSLWRGPILTSISDRPAWAGGPQEHREGMRVHTFGKGIEGMRISSGYQTVLKKGNIFFLKKSDA